MPSKTKEAQCAEQEAMKTFSDNLIRLRFKQKLDQAYVARMLGHKRQFLHRMELGQVMPSVGGLILLAQFYGVSVDELLFGSAE